MPGLEIRSISALAVYPVLGQELMGWPWVFWKNLAYILLQLSSPMAAFGSSRRRPQSDPPRCGSVYVTAVRENKTNENSTRLFLHIGAFFRLSPEGFQVRLTSYGKGSE